MMQKAILLCVLCGCLAGAAWSDGAMFAPIVRARSIDIYEPSQKAFIYYQDGQEDLVIEVSYKGNASDFAWVVPVPSQPRVRKLEGAPFHELSRLTAPRPRRSRQMGSMMMGAFGAAPVTVLERKKVGIYDVSVLASTDSDALVRWLKKNGYAFPLAGADIVSDYVRRGWVFVAMRITLPTRSVEQGLKEGVIQPLRLTFPTRKIIYPMKLTALNEDDTEVLLYVAAPYRVKAKGFREEWRNRVNRSPASLESYPTLRKIIKQACTLTKLRAIIDPAGIREDVSLSRRWL
ncbi:MAG: DUF2330 domain-containing protein [Armatimonadetes bacterium]|nr:DUF2330 domain-containing protein [Armatimonadota bacterium]